MKAEADKWMEKAESDLVHAEFSLKSKHYDWSALASQQAAEKALKAVCISKGKGLLRVHELTMLARKVGAPKEVIEKCGLLNPFYTAARYPDAEDIADKEAQEAAARDAFESAGEVIEWCRKQTRT